MWHYAAPVVSTSSYWLAICVSRRHFNVIQRGNDREVSSLFSLLGFGNESEAHRIRRTRAELRQGFMREAMKLKDPQNNRDDAAKLAELHRAYTLLSDDRFRVRYAGHHYASPDAALHLHVEGGQVAANHNPHHQSFEFVDHAVSASSLSSSSSCAQRSFGDFVEAFRSAKGVFDGWGDAHPYHPRETRVAQNGKNVDFLLRISFDESILGCTKTAVYEKDVTCSSCGGEGQQALRKAARKCPQCRGRGYTRLPSATYHVERLCGYCAGEGVAPPQKCGLCNGAGVMAGHTVSLPIDLRPGTTTMTVKRLRGKGHDGRRGGAAGDLIVTVLVQEHRLFHRDGLDLHIVLPIPLSTALLGGVVSVPTLHGPRQVRVPPCVQNGQQIIMEGQGVRLDDAGNAITRVTGGTPAESRNEQQTQLCGHMYIHLLVVIPKRENLTGAQKGTLEKFTALFDYNNATDAEETLSAMKCRMRQMMMGP